MGQPLLVTGQRLGPVRVERLIGRGGISEVYLVTELALGLPLALKILVSDDPEWARRMLREGRAQHLVRHPNVVQVHGSLAVGGRLALLLDFVPGTDLRRWLQDRLDAGRWPPLPEAFALFRGILAGVEAAHARGFVHRDLKPANVLLDLSGPAPVPRLTDFGLVRDLAPGGDDDEATQTGAVVGTRGYIAPEQIWALPDVDARADVYALGCLLFLLCCRREPFTDEDEARAFRRALAEDYPDPRSLTPDLPACVAEAIRRCLAAERAARPPDGAALRALLEAAGPPASGGSAGPPASGGSAEPPASRGSAASAPTEVPAEVPPAALTGPSAAHPPRSLGRLFAAGAVGAAIGAGVASLARRPEAPSPPPLAVAVPLPVLPVAAPAAPAVVAAPAAPAVVAEPAAPAVVTEPAARAPSPPVARAPAAPAPPAPPPPEPPAPIESPPPAVEAPEPAPAASPRQEPEPWGLRPSEPAVPETASAAVWALGPPPEPSRLGRVLVQGSPVAFCLRAAAGGEPVCDNRVPAGTWEVLLRLPDGSLTPAGRVEVVAGQVTTMACDPLAMTCR